MPFQQEIVNWTGDSVTNRLIATSFPLDSGVVAVTIIRRVGAFSLSLAHNGEVGTTYRCGTTTEIATGVLAFEAGGFRVGTAAEVNGGGLLYTAIIWRDSSADQRYLRTGAYAGDGVDNRAITVGFQPTHVWVVGLGWAVKTPEMPATGSVIFAEAGGDTTINAIKTFTPTGFTVGNVTSQVNALFLNYAWVALQTTTAFDAFFKSFKHTGLGGAGQVVSGFKFDPSHVYCQRFQGALSLPESFARGPQHAGTESLNIQLNAIGTTGIDGLGVGSLSLGDLAAPSGVDVYGYAVATSGALSDDVICLVDFPVDVVPADSACVAPEPPQVVEGYLLQENGFYILQEDGFRILLDPVGLALDPLCSVTEPPPTTEGGSACPI